MFAGRQRHKKLFAAGTAYKKNVWMRIFSKPRHSGTGRTCFGNLNSVNMH